MGGENGTLSDVSTSNILLGGRQETFRSKPREPTSSGVGQTVFCHSAIYYGAVAIAICIALSPALFFTFGYHNDFNAWAYDTHKCCAQHPETEILLAIGRYFGAYAQNLQFTTIHTLHDLWIWRLIGIVSTALLAVYYLYIVSPDASPTWKDACLSVAIFTLPTMQWQAMWVSMYTFWTPPMLLSLAAANLIRDSSAVPILPIPSWLRRTAPRLVLAFVALLAGLCFYPMSATLLLVPAAHLLLNHNEDRTRRMAALSVAALGGAFVAYFAIHKFIVLPRLTDVPYLGNYTFTFTGSILSEAIRRIVSYLAIGSYLWVGFELPWVPIVVAVIAVIALVFGAVGLLRRSTSQRTYINFLMACGLFVVAAAPVVLASQFSVTLRIMFTMTAIELLLFFWVLTFLPVAGSLLASVIAAIGIVAAFFSVYGTSASNAMEYAIDRRAVAGLAPTEFHSILVLRRAPPRRAFGLGLRGEFGVLAPIPHVFDQLIGSRYFDDPSGPTPRKRPSFDAEELYVGLEDAEPVLEKNATIIDLSPVYGQSAITDFSEYATVAATPRGEIGPLNAVDGVSDTFWEVCGHPFPMQLELDFPTTRTLKGYAMSTIEGPERMPSKWEIWVTSDQRNWHRIQEMAETNPWKEEEKREYGIKPVAEITGIRLVINETRVDSCMRLYEFTPTF